MLSIAYFTPSTDITSPALVYLSYFSTISNEKVSFTFEFSLSSRFATVSAFFFFGIYLNNFLQKAIFINKVTVLQHHQFLIHIILFRCYFNRVVHILNRRAMAYIASVINRISLSYITRHLKFGISCQISDFVYSQSFRHKIKVIIPAALFKNIFEYIRYCFIKIYLLLYLQSIPAA